MVLIWVQSVFKGHKQIEMSKVAASKEKVKIESFPGDKFSTRLLVITSEI